MACGQAVNVTALGNDIVRGFIRPPDVRGTTQIVYSCLLTITACIYTSVHLNVPPPGEAAKRQTLRRIKWTFVGILAPEVVLFAAWTQYLRANELIDKMCKVAPDLVYTRPKWHQRLRNSLSSCLGRKMQSEDVSAESQMELLKPTTPSKLSVTTSSAVDVADIQESRVSISPSPSHDQDTRHSSEDVPKKRRLIDLSYGFYVIMGGIRIDTSSIHDSVTSMVPSLDMLMSMLDKQDESYDGVYLVSKLLVNPSTIQDRSKADNMAKVLICCQVIGMAVQCVARRVSSLPLTLLEVHTFAHVVCAILLYTTWFKKPLNISEATIVSLPDLYVANFASQAVVYEPRVWRFKINRPCTCNLSDFSYELDENRLLALDRRHHSVREPPSGVEEIEYIEATHNNLAAVRLDSFCAIIGDEGLIYLEPPHENTCSHYEERIRLRLPLHDDKERRRWKFWQQGSISGIAELRQSNYFRLFGDAIRRELLDINPTIEALVQGSGLEEVLNMVEERWVSGVGAFVILSLYAGIHLTAWKAYFPTYLETWLWRGSGLFILSFGPVCMFLFLVIDWCSDSNPWSYAIIVVCALSIVLMIMAAAVARLLLVVEPFVALRAGPASIYQTVSWSQYIPHL